MVSPPTKGAHPMQPVLFADDKQFWYQTQRVLGHAAYGGADTGEVLATVQRIVSGDYDSWHDEWLATAERIAREAEGAVKAGHRISGRDGLLRASNYYRCAEFFLHGQPDDPRIDYSYEQSVACFERAAALFRPAVEPVEIPFEPATLHGYFHRGAGHGLLPTVIMHNGFDGPAEEMHFFGAAAAAERGYNVLSFDGPGQPAARPSDRLPFRPDWENVVTPVVDWVMTRPGVDQFRVALLGVSMGGYLAARRRLRAPPRRVHRRGRHLRPGRHHRLRIPWSQVRGRADAPRGQLQPGRRRRGEDLLSHPDLRGGRGHLLQGPAGAGI